MSVRVCHWCEGEFNDAPRGPGLGKPSRYCSEGCRAEKRRADGRSTRARRMDRERRTRNKARGACVAHPDIPAVPGRARCADCLLRNAESQAAVRERRKREALDAEFGPIVAAKVGPPEVTYARLRELGPVCMACSDRLAFRGGYCARCLAAEARL